jgi:hypothetical protein
MEMGNMNNLFDQEIKKTFSGFEVTPDTGVWDSIASQLSAKTKTRPFIPFWLRIAAGVAILLGTSITTWLIFNNPRTLDDSFVEAAVIDQEKGPEKQSLDEVETLTPTLYKTPTQTRLLTKVGPTSDSDITILDESSGIREENNQTLTPRLAFLKSIVYISPKPIVPVQARQLLETPKQKISDNLLASVAAPREPVDDFSIGVYFAPQFSYRSIDQSAVSSIAFNELESPLLTFSAGAFARFKVFDRLSIQIGLEYNVVGQFLDNISSVQHQPHFPKFEVNPITGTGHPQTLQSSLGTISFTDETLVFADLKGNRIKSPIDFFSSTNLKRMRKDDLGLSQQLTFIDVPIMLNLRLLNIGNTSLSIKGGGGVGYLVQNQVFLGRNVFSSSIGKTQGLRNISFFASGGLAFDYKISNSLRFSIEPTFQQYLRSLFEESPSFAPATPFKYSINTGVVIDF